MSRVSHFLYLVVDGGELSAVTPRPSCLRERAVRSYSKESPVETKVGLEVLRFVEPRSLGGPSIGLVTILTELLVLSLCVHFYILL